MFFVRRYAARAVLPALLSVAVGATLIGPVRSVAQAATLPERPRVYLDTTYVPLSGRTIAVAAGGDLQAALNTAAPGDVITLQAGATFLGPFTLPNKTGSGWIIVRTSAPDSSLPPPGTRITPVYAPLLPKIVVGSGVGGAIRTASGAHHFRFIGVEFAPLPGAFVYALIELGTGETSAAALPHNIFFDRCYIHGDPVAGTRRGIAMNSASTAVIDSYLSDFKEAGADSQAIAGWNGTGPFKIVNNYLEGAGENVILGGADPSIQSLVPSDIEIRGNYFFKPLAWRGTAWTVKNLFELKNAQRVLVEGNIFENNWLMAQNGFAILFTVRNQDGTAPWSVVQDVTFTKNIVRHSGSGVNLLGLDNLQPSEQTKRILLQDNLFEDIDGVKWGGSGRLFQILAGLVDLTIDHNTGFQTGNLSWAEGGTSLNFIYSNNLTPKSEYGFLGTGTGEGIPTLSSYFPGAVFVRNIIAGAAAANYPADNFFPATLDQVGFVDLAGGNFRLAETSPYKHAGTDGKDIGADIDAIAAATANVITGIGSASADTTPPSIALTAPLSGTTIAGTVVVAASAGDNVGIAGVQFKLDGANLGVEDTTNAYSISWDTTTVSNGSHTLTAVARDAAGNTTISAGVSVTAANVDTTPPALSSITVSSIGLNSAAIAWTTNEPSDSQVEYGLTTAYGSLTALEPTPLTAHLQTLTGLTSGTLYHYRVRSRDGSGNLVVSADFTFTTSAPDLTPPSSPTGLTATAVSSSQINLAWSPSTDDVGVAGYRVFRDSVQVATTSTAAYQNTGLSPSTTYAYTVAAFDAAGNTSAQSSPISATTLPAGTQSPFRGTPFAVPGLFQAEDFDNGGEGVAYHDLSPGNQGGLYRTGVDVDIISPYAGGYVVNYFQTGEWLEYTITVSTAGTYRLEALVSSEFTTSRWHADIDGVNVTGPVPVPHTGSWYTFQWVGVGGIPLTAGQHVLRISADQEYFNLDALRSVSEDTTSPSVSVTAPTAGATVTGTITVTANASDNVAVAGVQFTLDGANLGPEDTTNAYAISWDTSMVGNGSYTLTAVARDAAGNVTTSAPVSVNVANDTMPPTISSVAVVNISDSSATITWTTDEATDSQVEYGSTTAYGSAIPLDTTMVTAHTVTLSGLAAGTLYHYRVKSKDAAGNLTSSGDFTFTTGAAPAPTARSPFKGTPFAIPGQFQAEDFDNGGEGVASHDLTPGNQGGLYRTDVDVDIISPYVGGYVVNNFQTGEWLEYTITVALTGSYRLDLLVSSEFTTSRWHADIDGVPVTGSIAIPHTGSWYTFQWVGVGGIPLTAGQHLLRVWADQEYFNLDALRLVAEVSPPSPFKGTPFAMPGLIQAEDFDNGGEGVASHDLTPGNQGGLYRTTVDVDITSPSAGTYVVNGFQTGEWLKYTITVTLTGTYRLELLVSSEFTTSRWHADIDGVPVTGSIAVPHTGSWYTFQWVGVGGIPLTAGQHLLRVWADQEYFNLDALRIVAQ